VVDSVPREPLTSKAKFHHGYTEKKVPGAFCPEKLLLGYGIRNAAME
jgi:hypothetical protein